VHLFFGEWRTKENKSAGEGQENSFVL